MRSRLHLHPPTMAEETGTATTEEEETTIATTTTDGTTIAIDTLTPILVLRSTPVTAVTIDGTTSGDVKAAALLLRLVRTSSVGRKVSVASVPRYWVVRWAD